MWMQRQIKHITCSSGQSLAQERGSSLQFSFSVPCLHAISPDNEQKQLRWQESYSIYNSALTRTYSVSLVNFPRPKDCDNSQEVCESWLSWFSGSHFFSVLYTRNIWGRYKQFRTITWPLRGFQRFVICSMPWRYRCLIPLVQNLGHWFSWKELHATLWMD